MKDPRTIIAEIWKWLPTFRAVAETQSVTQAGRALGVSPPAVSRALRQIEDALGHELFDRRGRQLILNPDGEALLTVLREMETQLYAQVTRLAGGDVGGSVRLAAVGQLGSFFLLPAAVELGRAFPSLEVSIVHVDPEAAIAQLEARMLDLYLALNVAAGEPLVSDELAKLDMAIYAGRGHPLFDSELGWQAALEHGFVAQRRPALMKSVWPGRIQRHIALKTDSHTIALEACLGGSHLMVMERMIGRRLVAEGALREIRADFLEPASLVLLRHGHTTGDVTINRVAEAIERTVKVLMAEAARESSPGLRAPASRDAQEAHGPR